MNRLQPRKRTASRPPAYPFSAEVMHRRALYRLFKELRDVLTSELADNGPLLIAQANLYRPDAEEDAATLAQTGVLQAWAATLETMLSRVADRMVGFIREAAASVFAAGRYADAVNRREWKRVIREAYGVDVTRGEPRLPELFSAWENQNLALIKSLPEGVVDQLRGRMTDALVRGTSLRDLRRIIIERTDASVSRATLIARDQIGKLNGQLAQYRQSNAGVKEYVWRTMADERVRPTHRSFNGKTYSWKRGSPEGHPGEPIQCRCVADPIFPELTLDDGEMGMSGVAP
jgi:SPP1 gp7 family putative phage head morphogenesis protein